MSNRDWTPRSLPGGVYCSPACGGRCARADYDAAVAGAETLVRRLGKGWEPVVWENLGWHYKVTKGVFEITMDRNCMRYTAWFQGEKQFLEVAATPEDALGLLRQTIRTTIHRIEAQLADAA